MNFVITGHTSGIGKIIFDHFGGVGLSRTTNFDICKDSIIEHIDNQTIFINNAFSYDCLNAQVDLIYKSVDIVKQVICIGSNTVFPGEYKEYKDKLDETVNYFFSKGYNITNIKLGKVDTPFQQNYTGPKISKTTIIRTIDYIVNTPERINTISIRT